MSDSETLLYFAYGSNMYSLRLRARVPSAWFYGIGRLPGYCLAFAKAGADGSCKCDLEPFEPETVWGTLYEIDASERPLLDAAEGDGYRRIDVSVATSHGLVDAFTYCARPDWRCDGLPYTWYRDLVVAGARENELPEVYCAALADMDAMEDPDGERAAREAPGS